MNFHHVSCVSYTHTCIGSRHRVRIWVHGEKGQVLENTEYGPLTLAEALDLIETILRSGPHAGDEGWIDGDGRFSRQLTLL